MCTNVYTHTHTHTHTSTTSQDDGLRRAFEIVHLLMSKTRVEEVAFERLQRLLVVNWESDRKNLETRTTRAMLDLLVHPTTEKVCVRAYIHTCMHACIHSCRHAYMGYALLVGASYVFFCINTACMHTYIQACMHTYTCVCTYMLTHECKYMYIYVYIYIYIYLYINTCTHTYMYVYICL